MACVGLGVSAVSAVATLRNRGVESPVAQCRASRSPTPSWSWFAGATATGTSRSCEFLCRHPRIWTFTRCVCIAGATRASNVLTFGCGMVSLSALGNQEERGPGKVVHYSFSRNHTKAYSQILTRSKQLPNARVRNPRYEPWPWCDTKGPGYHPQVRRRQIQTSQNMVHASTSLHNRKGVWIAAAQDLHSAGSITLTGCPARPPPTAPHEFDANSPCPLRACVNIAFRIVHSSAWRCNAHRSHGASGMPRMHLRKWDKGSESNNPFGSNWRARNGQATPTPHNDKQKVNGKQRQER